MTDQNLSGQQIAKQLIEKNELAWEEFDLLLRAFKAEQVLEVWSKGKNQKTWKKIEQYPFCASSGTLGPKRQEGDLQIPEGVYFINRFNPKSKFHLSLGLNYPNAADLIHADASAPGSDIFIHGGCETIGCIPITNPKIEILFALANQAKANEQEQIPVHIFPAKFSNTFYQNHSASPHLSFWKSLYPIYKAFEQNRELPTVEVDSKGQYFLLKNEL